MSLSVRRSSDDDRTIEIWSKAVLVGVVTQPEELAGSGAPFRWSSCFSVPCVAGECASVEDAAQELASRWRAWISTAGLAEPPPQDLARRAFVAVHRALVAQRSEIDQLRGLVLSKHKRAAPRRRKVIAA